MYKTADSRLDNVDVTHLKQQKSEKANIKQLCVK